MRNVLALSRSIWYRPGMAHKKLSDEIRDAVNASGMSRYAIAKTLGIAESTMSRFMSGKGGLSMEFIDRLADLLGIHVVVRPTKKERGK
jgi:transcriptional regulator with XRE-family HTH domain